MKGVARYPLYLIIALIVAAGLSVVYFKAIHRAREKILDFTSDDLIQACQALGVYIEDGYYKPAAYLNAKKGAEIARMLINICVPSDEKELYEKLRDIANNCNDPRFDTDIVHGNCYPCDLGECMGINENYYSEYAINYTYYDACYLGVFPLHQYPSMFEIYSYYENEPVKMEELSLTISQVDEGADCSKNYLAKYPGYTTFESTSNALFTAIIDDNLCDAIANKTMKCGTGFSAETTYTCRGTVFTVNCTSKIKYIEASILSLALDWCKAAMVQYQYCLNQGNRDCNKELLNNRNWCKYIDTSNLAQKTENNHGSGGNLIR